MYSLQQMIDKVEASEFGFCFNGHFGAPDAGQDEHLVEMFKELLLRHLTVMQELIAEPAESTGPGYQYVEKRRQQLESQDGFQVGLLLPSWSGSFEIECGCCGERLLGYLAGPETIGLALASDFPSVLSPINGGPTRCKYGAGSEHTFLSALIQVTTGNLLFTNYFDGVADTPEGKEHSRGYSLNHIAGRNRRMRHMAGQDVGYGQMGNLTADIFVDSKGERIRIVHECRDVAESNLQYYRDRGEEVDPRLEATVQEFAQLDKDGFEFVGSICLSMWRWMCADHETLEDLGVEPDEEQDQVELVVQPGSWEIKHYYGVTPGHRSIIGSELNLVANG